MSGLEVFAVAWVGLAICAAVGFACGTYLERSRLSRLTPNDHVLRDVARQRDRLMRERDEAIAAAQRCAMSHMKVEVELIQLRNAMTRIPHGRPN
jgi:hypothetical protein